MSTTAGHEADVALIHELWLAYASALACGDMDRWISLWSSEGIEIRPAGLLFSGTDQIRAALQPEMDLFDTDMIISPDNVRIRGDCAFTYGTYTHALTPKEGGESIRNHGMFLTVLEKQANGAWKITISCFNNSYLPRSTPGQMRKLRP